MTMTYGQTMQALDAALGQWLKDDDDDFYVYVNDFSDSWVIYSTKGENFQVSYSVAVDGSITFSGTPVAVAASTTWVPVAQANAASGGERRVVVTGSDIAARAAVRGQRPAPSVQVRSEPYTYRPDAADAAGNGVSWIRDLYMRDRDTAARTRLDRHGREMDDLRERRAAQALRDFDSRGRELLGDGFDGRGFEYRVNPNTTQGTGGYATPPAWLIDLAATFQRPKRVLASLVNQLPLPRGASSINIPRMTAGNAAGRQTPGAANDANDVTDAATSGQAVTISGQGDIALQVLEMSPVSGGSDLAWFKDLAEAYDASLESQLIQGTGGTGGSAQFTGILNVANITAATYTDASPTGSEMYPIFGQAVAHIGNNRGMPPSLWLMRTARWGWLMTQEDSQNRPLEVPTLEGRTPQVPGSLLGWPCYMDDSISQNLTYASSTFSVGATANEDVIIACIPSDLFLFEASPAMSSVDVEPLSGTLQVRLTYRNYAAAITGRYPTGIVPVAGTGMTVQSGFTA